MVFLDLKDIAISQYKLQVMDKVQNNREMQRQAENRGQAPHLFAVGIYLLAGRVRRLLTAKLLSAYMYRKDTDALFWAMSNMCTRRTCDVFADEALQVTADLEKCFDTPSYRRTSTLQACLIILRRQMIESVEL